MKTILITISLLIPSLSYAVEPYISFELETSSGQVQLRDELGLTFDRNHAIVKSIYLYHESDPRNGLEGNGWERETENGIGVEIKFYLDN